MLGAYLTFGAAPSAPPRTVVVLGAARGGTSMVAGILRILGVDMGVDLDPSNNEDRAFLGHRGNRVIFNDKTNDAARGAYLDRIRAHIELRARSSALWGWKDPMASYYIRDVAGLLPSPVFIAITRDLAAIAIRENHAEKPTNPASVPAYFMNAAHDYIRIVQFLATNTYPALLLSYERSLRQPRNIVAAIRDFVRLPENPEAESRAVRFVVPDRVTGHIEPVSAS